MKKIHLLFVLLFLSACTSHSNAQESKEFKVAPYLQFATKTSMVVMWETKEPATTLVEYSEAVLNSGEPLLNQKKVLNGNRTMHEVVLDGLSPETNYFYRVTSVTESGKEIVSQTYPFKTAVNDSSAYMFALIGDTQRNGRTPWGWERVAKQVWKDRPNFVVHVGDVVDNGNNLDDWTDEFFPDGQILMSKAPIYPAIGNHENDSPLYYQYIHAPEPEYYYTFNYGNAQFFIVDTNRDVSEGSEQYNWLEWELAKSNATWKVVLHHHPPYSSEENDHGDSWKEASTMGTHARNLVPLLEKYNVDFDLFGHTHVYERTWPIFQNGVNMQNGVIYVNSGGAGGGLEDFAPTRNWFTAELQTGHHYVTFAIFDRTLIYKAIDSDGHMFDTFQMTKEAEDAKASIVQPPAPKILPRGGIFENEREIELAAAFENLTIRYTTDGSEPTSSSNKYTGPFTIKKSATVRTRAFSPEGRASRVNEATFRKVEPLEAVKIRGAKVGLDYKFFDLKTDLEWLPDFTKLTPSKTGKTTATTLESVTDKEEFFAIVYEGYIDIKEEGRYMFSTNSDDGSTLYIHDQLIVDNDGSHGMRERSGEVILKKGLHPIRIEFYQGGGGADLQVTYRMDKFGSVMQTIPADLLKSK